MTEETNQETPATAPAATPAAEPQVNVDSAGADKGNETPQPTSGSGSAGPIVGGDAGGAGGVGSAEYEAPAWPNVSVGNKVWLRGPNDPVAMTCAIVTQLNGGGSINVTAFYDGEVPRPVANVEYGNADLGKLGWFPN